MQSVVSYPERGEGGANTYRGNCSPRLIEDLLRHFKPDAVSDYMVGSGTTSDVAEKLGISHHCYDLNRGFDLVGMDVPERSPFIFWHPPYMDLIDHVRTHHGYEVLKPTPYMLCFFPEATDMLYVYTREYWCHSTLSDTDKPVLVIHRNDLQNLPALLIKRLGIIS